MFQEQNSKSKERLRLEEQRAKYEQRLREQIKKDERRRREREKSLKLLIGELFTKNLPDYMLYEEAEIESGTDKGRFSARMLGYCKLMTDGK